MRQSLKAMAGPTGPVPPGLSCPTGSLLTSRIGMWLRMRRLSTERLYVQGFQVIFHHDRDFFLVSLVFLSACSNSSSLICFIQWFVYWMLLNFFQNAHIYLRWLKFAEVFHPPVFDFLRLAWDTVRFLSISITISIGVWPNFRWHGQIYRLWHGQICRLDPPLLTGCEFFVLGP